VRGGAARVRVLRATRAAAPAPRLAPLAIFSFYFPPFAAHFTFGTGNDEDLEVDEVAAAEAAKAAAEEAERIAAEGARAGRLLAPPLRAPPPPPPPPPRAPLLSPQRPPRPRALPPRRLRGWPPPRRSASAARRCCRCAPRPSPSAWRASP